MILIYFFYSFHYHSSRSSIFNIVVFQVEYCPTKVSAVIDLDSDDDDDGLQQAASTRMTAKKQPPQKPPASLLSPGAALAAKATPTEKATPPAKASPKATPTAVTTAAASATAASETGLAAELAELKRKNEELMALLAAKASPVTPQEKAVFSPPAVLPKAPPAEPPASLEASGEQGTGGGADAKQPGKVLDPTEAELASRFDLSDKD